MVERELLSLCICLFAAVSTETGSASALGGEPLSGVGLATGQCVLGALDPLLRDCQEKADQGDAVGQFRYGETLIYGIGVDCNPEEAVRYYRLAADQGHKDAQYLCGLALMGGDGVAENLTESARYYKLAADQGHPDAQFFYAQALMDGEGVSQDLVEAERYFKLAADQGQEDAELVLIDGVAARASRE